MLLLLIKHNAYKYPLTKVKTTVYWMKKYSFSLSLIKLFSLVLHPCVAECHYEDEPYG